MRKALASLFVLALGAASPAWAQPALGNNPLSRQGIGDFAPTLLSRNLGMGGVGIASPSPEHINLLNPALLTFNRVTNLELGIFTRTAWLSDGNNTQRFGGGGPQSITFAFPVHRRVTVAAGLTPYSYLDYNTEATSRLEATGDTVGYGLRGSGTVNRAFISTGVNLGKGLAAGLDIGYLFGTLKYSQETVVLPVYSNLRTLQTTSLSFRDFTFRPGISYRKAVDSAKAKYMTWGLTADIGRNAVTRREVISQLLGNPNTTFVIDQDTATSGLIRVQMPTTVGLGFSYQRLLHWNLAADVVYGRYDNVAVADANSGLKNTMTLRVGGELIPDINKNGYFNLVNYRAGFSIGQSPYTYQGNQLLDYSASVGASFPILRKEARYMRPTINLAVVAGSRATTTGPTLRENYLRLVLGFTLNDNLWFQRYKLD